MSKVILIVLDSVGVGELPDAHLFGDQGSNTLGKISRQVNGLKLPNMEKMGLGNLTDTVGVRARLDTNAAYGKMAEKSKGKDTTNGHWELMGVVSEKIYRTYPNAFPADMVEKFSELTGRKIIGNEVASGTEIIERLGTEHLKEKALILYTSADSVFQIAAHEEIVPLSELYRCCEIARKMIDENNYEIARVIARPFIGITGSFVRTANRKDYSVQPPGTTLLDSIIAQGQQVIAIGKIGDIFAGQGITMDIHTTDNLDGIEKIIKYFPRLENGLIFANLVDFDSKFGHRRDSLGYAEALESFDKNLPRILDLIGNENYVFIVADHGCDPTFKGTDHTREYVPLLIFGPEGLAGKNLGIRESFSDTAATIAKILGIKYDGLGVSVI